MIDVARTPPQALGASLGTAVPCPALLWGEPVGEVSAAAVAMSLESTLGLFDAPSLESVLGADLHARLRGRLLARSGDYPGLENALHALPAATTSDERKFLYGWFRSAWSGGQSVLELGPFLGASTRAIALGMLANPRRRVDTRLVTLDCFELAPNDEARREFESLVQPLCDAGVVTRSQLDDALDSRDFGPLFTSLHAPHAYAEIVLAERARLPGTPDEERSSPTAFAIPEGPPFDAVFVDGCKSWYGTKVFMQQVAPRVAPGATFIFQDYGAYTCFWISSLIALLNECLDLIACVDHTYVYTLREPLDAARIGERFPDSAQDVDRDVFERIFDALASQACLRSDVFGLLLSDMHRASALATLGHRDDARAILSRLADAPAFELYRPNILNALKSPTYTPEGDIFL